VLRVESFPHGAGFIISDGLATPIGVTRLIPWFCARGSEFATAADAGQDRVDGMNDRIVIDPKVCHGKPVIRGTRTPVALFVGSLAGGMGFDEVAREYGLTVDDIRAALKFAGQLVEQEQYHPLPA